MKILTRRHNPTESELHELTMHRLIAALFWGLLAVTVLNQVSVSRR